jgi:hypothetical protein
MSIQVILPCGGESVAGCREVVDKGDVVRGVHILELESMGPRYVIAWLIDTMMWRGSVGVKVTGVRGGLIEWRECFFAFRVGCSEQSISCVYICHGQRECHHITVW